MIIQRNTTTWPADQIAPEVDYHDVLFDGSESGAVFLTRMLGPPCVAVIYTLSGTAQLRKRYEGVVRIRRVES